MNLIDEGVVKNRKVWLIFGVIMMLFSLFMGAVSIAYAWAFVWVLFFTFVFLGFLVFCGGVYIAGLRNSELEKMRKERDAAQKDADMRLQYLANMAHEIRTPINAIIGYDELILREYNDPALRQYASNIKAASNSLLAIVNDSLDYSRMVAGKMELLPAEYDLGIVLEEIISMIRPRILAKGLEMKCFVNKDMPHILYGDSDRLKQCMINILTNAVKYTEEGEIVLSVDYKQLENDSATGKKEIVLIVSVRDTGIGIKEEDLKRLYSPFERIDEVKIKAVEGSGLGMSIVKRILALMDSKLEVESVYGEGSNFHFEVKQEVMRMDPLGNFEKMYTQNLVNENSYKNKFHAPSARILVVDDADMNLSVIEGLLKETRIQIDSALSAATGLELAATNEYDIIFIDLRMSGMNGGEMVNVIHGMSRDDKEEKRRRDLFYRRQDKDKKKKLKNEKTPCIALTAGALQEVQSEYIKLGFADYLLKPIVYKELEMVLLHYLPEEKVILLSERRKHNREKDIPSLMTTDKLREAVGILQNREARL